MSEADPLVQPEKPEYYYDTSQGIVIKGGKFLERHLALGVAETSIKPLDELLRDDSPVDQAFSYDRSATRETTSKDCVKYGKWLLGVVGPAESKGQKTINTALLARAWELGLGPGPWTIRNRFGSVSEFYRQVQSNNTHRIGIFDGWDIEDYVEYFRKVGDEIGGRPSFRLLRERHHDDPSNPSPITVYKKYRAIGGINRIAELAGYTVIDLWENQDYVDWGVKFMKANGGLPPIARSINFLSKKKLGPSTFPIAKRFGSIVDYREQVIDTYREDAEASKREKERKLNDIELGIKSGWLPRELFDDVDSEDSMLLRYARYIVTDDLLPDNFKVSKLSIGLMSKASVVTDGFVRSIRKLNNAITAGDIESTALYLGVFNDIWPPDNRYMDELKVPDDIGVRRRINQYATQLEVVKV